MSIGDFVLVNTFMLQLFMPLGFLGIVYRQMKHSLADMDQLIKLLEEKAEIRDKEGAAVLQATRGEVRFDHVAFAYQPERPILHDIDFTIAPGQKLAVIDGQDIRDVTQDSLRAAIGIVPQDTVLFNESLYYNLLYARTDATREDIMEAARLAQLHDFISNLPDGYDTIVGERGLKLSGGEKQRVAIARVILKRPKILVFDEATSALDSASEQASTDHTTLVIAHRLSTIVDADKIMVMKAGRVIEQGTHQMLLGHKGEYAHLWELQQKERDRVRTED
jgi:ATP-binding cassette subfamily B protein